MRSTGSIPTCTRLHAAAPALVTWDDHEVQNDYADKYSQFFDDPALFLQRRAAAYQAFYEHMPVRPILSQPNGPVMRVYDRFRFGDLARGLDDRRPSVSLPRGLLRPARQAAAAHLRPTPPARSGATTAAP